MPYFGYHPLKMGPGAWIGTRLAHATCIVMPGWICHPGMTLKHDAPYLDFLEEHP